MNAGAIGGVIGGVNDLLNEDKCECRWDYVLIGLINVVITMCKQEERCIRTICSNLLFTDISVLWFSLLPLVKSNFFGLVILLLSAWYLLYN